MTAVFSVGEWKREMIALCSYLKRGIPIATVTVYTIPEIALTISTWLPWKLEFL